MAQNGVGRYTIKALSGVEEKTIKQEETAYQKGFKDSFPETLDVHCLDQPKSYGVRFRKLPSLFACLKFETI